MQKMQNICHFLQNIRFSSMSESFIFNKNQFVIGLLQNRYLTYRSFEICVLNKYESKSAEIFFLSSDRILIRMNNAEQLKDRNFMNLLV